MGSQRKMSSSFKRASLKSSTSGSQKVSEPGRAARGLEVWSLASSKAPSCRPGLHRRCRRGDGVCCRHPPLSRRPPFADTVPLTVTSWLFLPSCMREAFGGCRPCTYSGHAAHPSNGPSASAPYAHPLLSITCLW